MTQKRSQRLQPVHRLECVREEKALQALAAAMGQVRAARDRLQQLEQFATEYRARMLAPGRGRLSGSELQSLARFQSHLEGLIGAQQEIVRSADARLAEARRYWSDAHARQKAVDSVIGRFRDLEQVEEGRREQRETDELGIGRFRRGPGDRGRI